MKEENEYYKLNSLVTTGMQNYIEKLLQYDNNFTAIKNICVSKKLLMLEGLICKNQELTPDSNLSD